jgi:DNA-binding transcriptional ArsR family regulator
MTDDDRVFKALADPTRRFLLDRLFERDGRTLTELESELEMTRFGVMKHLRLLEDAGLVVARRSGREKLHFLNPVPIRLIHDRWIDKYTERQVSALADPTRRLLLDRLFERDGRTLTDLETGLEMTRFGVMKHLRVLEDADLVVTRRSGREKLHFLNPVPIRLIHDRWIDKYRERQVSALADLKHELEKEDSA